MADATDAWHAEMDLRVFSHLYRLGRGRADITPKQALGPYTEQRTIFEVVPRIYHMHDKGWIVGGTKDIEGVRDAALSGDVETGLGIWSRGENMGAQIAKLLAVADTGHLVPPEKFITLRDEALFFC